MSEFLKKYHQLKNTKKNIEFINKAIENSNNSDGGPFGAVITKNDIIIADGNNKVTIDNDPTAHAEIVAIRNACKELNDFNLSECVLYTSCEPCPMCLSAIYWSRIPVVYYANTRQDAASIDFDDQKIYDEISKNIEDREVKMIHIENTNAYETFQNWKNNLDKVHY
jgi:tRNA(Arg) A34 adenosine deaminase TadA